MEFKIGKNLHLSKNGVYVITNNDTIKSGDWVFDTINNNIFKTSVDIEFRIGTAKIIGTDNSTKIHGIPQFELPDNDSDLIEKLAKEYSNSFLLQESSDEIKSIHLKILFKEFLNKTKKSYSEEEVLDFTLKMILNFSSGDISLKNTSKLKDELKLFRKIRISEITLQSTEDKLLINHSDKNSDGFYKIISIKK